MKQGVYMVLAQTVFNDGDLKFQKAFLPVVKSENDEWYVEREVLKRHSIENLTEKFDGNRIFKIDSVGFIDENYKKFIPFSYFSVDKHTFKINTIEKEVVDGISQI